MWHLNSPWYEYVFRALLVYVVIFIVIRVVGKKHFSKYSILDITLIITMCLSLQKIITLNDQSLTGLAITLLSIILINIIINELSYHFSWIDRTFNKQPVIIILHGKIHKRVLKKERISVAELLVALREHEVMRPEDVKCAILETDGNISVFKNKH